MSEPPDDRDYFFNRRTDKTIVSRRIPDRSSGQNLRIFSKIVAGEEGLRVGTVGDEVVLRTTSAARYEIKATVIEDGRGVRTLTIQKYNSGSGPSDKFYFTFVGAEIQTLIQFAASIATADLSSPDKFHLSDDRARELILTRAEASRLFEEQKELFADIAERANLERDLIAIGFRRRQLQRFEEMLSDTSSMDDESMQHGGSVEAVWQKFFELNQWIFGYGLSYQFSGTLDGRHLEQMLVGNNVERFGRRADAVLKTRGALNSIAFAEIKRHDTALLDTRAYRSGVWSPSRELVGAVSQIQSTVQDAVEIYGRLIEPIDQEGAQTGERVLNVEPRSFVVIGRLSEFINDGKINQLKWRAFELYRRSLHRTEILTFDELFERAKYIVEHADNKDRWAT